MAADGHHVVHDGAAASVWGPYRALPLSTGSHCIITVYDIIYDIVPYMVSDIVYDIVH